MGILIVLLFVLIIGSAIVLLIPRKIALKIGGINQYDLQSVPTKLVAWVFVIASVILIVSLGVLFFILKDQLSPVPTFVETFLEWIDG